MNSFKLILIRVKLTVAALAAGCAVHEPVREPIIEPVYRSMHSPVLEPFHVRKPEPSRAPVQESIREPIRLLHAECESSASWREGGMSGNASMASTHSFDQLRQYQRAMSMDLRRDGKNLQLLTTIMDHVPIVIGR